MKTILLFLVLVSFSGIGCSDKWPDWMAEVREPKGKIVEIPKIEVSERSTDLTCYSAGLRIYSGSSIGKVRRIGDRTYQIKDKLDGKERFVSGDCVAIEQK